MNLPLALNAIFGSLIITVLIFANYIRKFTIDRYQRNIFCYILVFHFITMICDMVFITFHSMPGRHIHHLLHIVSIIYYLFQVLSFCYIAIFIDYIVFKNTLRTKRIIAFSYIYFVLHAIVLLINFNHGFYFYISSDNVFEWGNHFYIRILISLIPALFGLGMLAFGHSSFMRSHIIVTFVAVIFFALGAAADVLFETVGLLWPLGTSALLYAYLFVIRTESRIDPLTGIGNRYSFNIFTDKLSRLKTGDLWAIVMIDMDHFKKINDTLGHLEGDNALCDMATIIRDSTGKKDFAFRYGGDEFVLTTEVQKDGENEITLLMDKIKNKIEQYNSQNIRPFKLEISYGYGIYAADGSQPIESFLQHIDSLMYKNKQERRRLGDKASEAEK